MKHGRHVAGSNLAQTDPDKWVSQYYMPALKKAGFNSLDEMVGETRRAFPAGRSADLVSKLIQQQPSFENHAKLYDSAQGLNATGNNKSDPFVALNSLTTSLSNFAGALTSPAMSTAASTLDWMASKVGNWQNELSQFAEKHPDVAKYTGAGAIAGGLGVGAWGTGMLGYRLFNGFGLGASATALDGSAAALSAAAAELSGAAVAGGAGNAAKTASAVAGGGIWSLGARALPFAGPILGTAAAGYAL
jgi:hypothetical protein